MNLEYRKARHKLALMLWDIGAVLTAASDHPLVVEREGPNGKERGFKLKLHENNPDAPLSPFYLNLRTTDNPKLGPLTQEIIDQAAWCMFEFCLERKLTFDAVVGVPRAGDPFAQALTRFAGTTCLTMDKWEHQGKRRIASLQGHVLASVKKVLVVDDLITKADSKREAIEILRDAGMDVTDVMVLVDREQGGRKGLAEMGCTLHSIFTITELLDLYVEAGRMEPQLRDNILTYLAQT